MAPLELYGTPDMNRFKQLTVSFFQVLQQWELAEYERCAGSLETAIASAAQDALSDIRSLARSLFASFRLSMPLRANVLLSNLDQKTREKLQCGAPVISQGELLLLAVPNLFLWPKLLVLNQCVRFSFTWTAYLSIMQCGFFKVASYFVY